MTEDENFTPRDVPDYGPLGMLLLAAGALICVLATIETMNGLPFDMPRSWYLDRELWIGAGVAALIAGFLIQRPPRGDEQDTS